MKYLNGYKGYIVTDHCNPEVAHVTRVVAKNQREAINMVRQVLQAPKGTKLTATRDPK